MPYLTAVSRKLASPEYRDFTPRQAAQAPPDRLLQNSRDMTRLHARPHLPDNEQVRRHLDFQDTLPDGALEAAQAPAAGPAAPRPRTDPYQRVRLRSWPEMRGLAGTTLPTVARICALIARRPTAAYLVAARLHEATDTVLSLLDDLRDSGHVDADEGVLSLPFAVDGESGRPARDLGARPGAAALAR